MLCKQCCKRKQCGSSLKHFKTPADTWAFRNALVRANYNDLRNGIHATTEFLELFLRNLLLGEDHPLHNRTMHISGVFTTTEKADIDNCKTDIDHHKSDIEKEKADIANSFTAKSASHVCRLLDEYGFQTIFGRADVQKALGLKASRSSALLKDMVDKGFIEPVSGLGKGRYRFRPHQD